MSNYEILHEKNEPLLQHHHPDDNDSPPGIRYSEAHGVGDAGDESDDDCSDHHWENSVSEPTSEMLAAGAAALGRRYQDLNLYYAEDRYLEIVGEVYRAMEDERLRYVPPPPIDDLGITMTLGPWRWWNLLWPFRSKRRPRGATS